MIRYDRRLGRLLTPNARQTLRSVVLVAAGFLVLALLNAAATALGLGRLPWN